MRHTKYLPLDDRNKILTGQGGREGWWNAGWAGSGQQWAAHVTCPLVPMSGERDSAFQRPGQGGINPLVHDPQLLQTRDKHRHLVSTTSPLYLQGYQDVSHVWTLDKREIKLGRTLFSFVKLLQVKTEKVVSVFSVNRQYSSLKEVSIFGKVPAPTNMAPGWPT